MNNQQIQAIVHKLVAEELNDQRNFRRAVADKVSAELTKRGIKVAGTVHYDPQIAEYALEGKPLTESQAKEEVKQIVEVLLT